MRVTGSTKQNRSEDRTSSVVPLLVGIAGGSGSGKTYFAEMLRDRLGESICEIILQDSFYFDQSARFDFDGGSVNFDHPSSIDFSLLAERLVSLKSGNPVQIPIYDFVTHSRSSETVSVKPKPVILVDGILIFHSELVRGLFDELVFFDTAENLRFERRLKRDVHERGRTSEGVKAQFLSQVKPMHDAFVEPSKKFADYIVSEISDYDNVFEECFRRYQAAALK